MASPILTEDILSDIENSVLCWLATVDDDGHPNVSPKEIFSYCGDDSLIIADIASPNSVKNIKANSHVCVSFIDVFRQKGRKINGIAEIIAPDDERFDIVGKTVLAMAGPDFPVKHILKIKVTKTAPIIAPSYWIFPEKSEDDRLRSGYEIYGVKPNM